MIKKALGVTVHPCVFTEVHVQGSERRKRKRKHALVQHFPGSFPTQGTYSFPSSLFLFFMKFGAVGPAPTGFYVRFKSHKEE